MKAKNLFFIALLCFLCLPFFSQDKKLDSLFKVLNTHKADTAAAKAYLRIAGIYSNRGMVDSCDFYIKKCYDISKKLQYKKGLAASYNFLGQNFNYRGNEDSAIYYFTQAMKMYELLNDSARMSGMINNLGVVYKLHGNISKAMDYYFQALKIKDRLHDTEGIASAYTNIGHLFQEIRDTANTLKYYTLSLELRKKINDKWGLSNSLMSIGLFYQTCNKLDNALFYLTEGLKIADELGDEEMQAIGSYNIGNVYQKQKKMDEAVVLYKRSLELSKKNNNYEGIATCLETLAQIAFEQNNKKEAISLFEEAYEKATFMNNKELIQSIADKLSHAYESIGDYKRSLLYHKIFVSVKDSLFDQATARKLTSEILKYEHEKEKILLEREQEKKQAIARSEAFKKDLILSASVLFLIVVSIFTFIIFRRLKENRKQKDIIETQRNEMIDSINYAKRIQFALLAHADLLNNNLPEHFILFNPKDIVSGDFYWATKKADHFYLAVCDSTGHGVPGAFMSLLNISFLNEAINEKNILAPNKVLDHVRQRLLENMDGGQDGMDAVIIKIPANNKNLKIEYAAANNSPILIRNGEILELPKDKMPVGKGEVIKDFELQTIELQKGDNLYLYTDGFADQFGGPKGKKFKYKQLNQLLQAHVNDPMNKQQEILNSAIQNWKGDLEQVDDICIIGIRI
jgi:serine phosphatase RsbU (regulator of sigma subunit)/predicted negative regulator of RcsB-dependent stress response